MLKFHAKSEVFLGHQVDLQKLEVCVFSGVITIFLSKHISMKRNRNYPAIQVH